MYNGGIEFTEVKRSARFTNWEINWGLVMRRKIGRSRGNWCAL
jgi:hypothetical protein